MKLLPMLAAGSFQHHATRRQPSMKSSTSPTINPFHRIRGWIVFPESRWPGRWLLLVAAAVLVAATHFLFGSFPAYAQSPDGAISGLTLASDEAQTLTITWDAASPMPKHYEVYWTLKPGVNGNGGYGNGLSSGRATTTGTSYTATELSGSSVYGVGVRARYEESWGPWSDEEELKVLWPYVSPFYVAHDVQSIIRPNAVFRGSVYTNHVPRDNDPSTLDLAVRVDVVDTAGRSWNYCEQDGMGMFQNRYIIDDLLEGFYFHYGSLVGDCISGNYYIVYVVKYGTELKRLETVPFAVTGGAVAVVGKHLDGMPTITGTTSTGEMLTADISGLTIGTLPDGSSAGVLIYQWISSDGETETDIAGATEATYTLTESDGGKLVKVKVFRDVASFEIYPGLSTMARRDEAYSFPLLIDGVATSDATNQMASGAPTISGTVQVGQTLTASTSGISDSDGLTNATFAYQWLSSRDAEIDGATSSTYTLVEADEGKTIKVRVSFTDDRGHQETVTSTATAAVTAAPSPLTVSVESAPTSHNGSEAFRIRVAFSETPESGFSYTTMRDHAFTVTGGDVTGARRLVSGKNLRWEVTVQPSGTADVTVLLPATTDCAAQGAICTDNDDKLSNSLNLTVSGPEATPPPAVVASALTVSVESAPTSHNGSNSFRIRVAFSETPKTGFSYTTMRDHAFTVTGGDVTGARRLVSGKNLRWEITVQPSGNADVTVELPVTTDCAAQGAICTGNDDKLSNSLNLTVSGPN